MSRGGRREPSRTREKCSTTLCRIKQKHSDKEPVLIFIDPDFGSWDYGTGWQGEIYCPECGKRVKYVGASSETKASVEKKLRRLWRVANEREVDDGED